jgi:transcriptional antiterminator NusG
VVRNTPRVSGFLGTGVHPVPISDKEMLDIVEKMKESKNDKHSVNLEIGDFVKITDGPFKETEGKILSIDEVTGQLKIIISMFGRDTEVELDFTQVKSI